MAQKNVCENNCPPRFSSLEWFVNNFEHIILVHYRSERLSNIHEAHLLVQPHQKRTKSLSTSLTNLNRLKFLKGHRLNVTKNEVIHLFSCPSHSPSMLGKCLTSCRHSVKMWRSAITSGRACSSCARAPEPRSTSTTQAGLRRSTAAMQSMLWMMAGSPVRSQKS